MGSRLFFLLGFLVSMANAYFAERLVLGGYWPTIVVGSVVGTLLIVYGISRVGR